MMTDKPAFPLADGCRGGLTRRELFAAMAMQGLLANTGVVAEISTHNYLGDWADQAPMVAKASVWYADALIAALGEV